MALGRLIRRAAPLIVVGVAGAVAARRRAERQRQIQAPIYPPPVAEAGPVIEVEPEEETSDIGPQETSDLGPQTSEAEPEPEVVPEPEPEPAAEPEPEPEPEPAAEPEPEPSEQPTVEHTALERAPWLEEQQPEAGSVTDIVDDLLVPGDAIEDATVVDAAVVADDDQPDDAALTEAARAQLSQEPGIPGGVELEVREGMLVLSGEVERPEAITGLERRASEVPGIRSVSSLLHLPGTPPPAPSEHR